MSKLFILLFICWSSGAVMAQEDTVTGPVIAGLADRLPEAEDLSELTSGLSFYREHPIDLNAATPGQLKELVFLSALQISNFFIHRKASGKMSDLLELQGIDGFDLGTITRLLPFVTLRPAPAYTRITGSRVLSNGESELLLRYGQVLEKQKGYTSLPGSRYLGSPQKLLLRYHYHLDDLIAFSFVAEKDAGERFFKGNNRSGFDFLSGSLALYKTGRFSKIILGDYSLQSGQGLTLWTGASFGKGSDVAGVAKNETGLKAYTSANESSFFRGIGIEFNLLKSISLTSFISSKGLDASLSGANDGNLSLSAINASGLHRTATEITHKQNVHQLVYGMLGTYQTSRLTAGFSAYHSGYQYPFTTGKPLYKKYAFQGKALTNLGFHYSYTFKNIYFFGEVARSFRAAQSFSEAEQSSAEATGSNEKAGYGTPGEFALLNGAMTSLSPSLSAVILHRDYGKAYVSFYSQGLGEGSANEKGIYAGIHFSPTRKWEASLYTDLFRFPWAKYRIDKASSGAELMLQIGFAPRKTLKAILKLSTKLGEQNDTSGLPVNPVVHTQKDNLRLGLQWRISRKINLENRLEFTHYKKGARAEEYGYLIYQDTGYQPMSSRLSANLRLAWFSTPSYDSRIYAYEDDVLNGSGSGLYSGRGIRAYLNLSYRLSRQLRIWCRYATYYYPGKEKTGSGLEEISGSKKSDIKIQLRYQF